ncbi:MAG TPA: type I-E CRISPR-associated protein Cse2/CasB [Caldilineaceae bacterium]|nr:type I-E CRISPR-associated protein Cse2/CasB [Caldilineaceae bacterium]
MTEQTILVAADSLADSGDAKASGHPLILLLGSLQENRAAMAHLRRGLGQPRSMAPEMHRYLLPLLPERISRWDEQSYYLIAALFALHPKSTTTGNLGEHFARTVAQAGDSGREAVERRFIALLDAHPDDLAFHLRQAIGYLRAREETPVHWQRLLYDVMDWGRHDRRPEVQRRWAQGFWRR